MGIGMGKVYSPLGMSMGIKGKSHDLWKQQIANAHLTSSSKHDLPGFFGDLSRPISFIAHKPKEWRGIG